MRFSPAELVLNSNGSVYHLHLLPEDISDKIVLVGDPDRVEEISKYFDTIEVKKQNREFVTCTGTYDGKRISIISTGIGTDNIDIVLNELDILASIDLEKRNFLEERKKLRFVRLGTCGILQENIPVGAFLESKFSVGFDALMHFYKAPDNFDEFHLKDSLAEHFTSQGIEVPFYVAQQSGEFNYDVPDKHSGITATLPGFYGPQGRMIRAQIKFQDFLGVLNSFSEEENKIVNFEMESSGLFGLANLLGHEASTICLGLANRITGEFLQERDIRMSTLIEKVLQHI